MINPTSPSSAMPISHQSSVLTTNYPLQADNDQLDERAWQDPELSLRDFVAGISQLAVMGVIETTGIAEAIHREIVLRPLGLLNHRYGDLWYKGISGRVYQVVKGITSIVGHSLAMGLKQYCQLMHHTKPHPLPNTLSMVVNVINGVMGDHLVSNNNPLALPMTLYGVDSHHKYTKPILSKRTGADESLSKLGNTTQTVYTNQRIKGRVVIILHGLCMGYINWQPDDDASLGRRVIKNLPASTVLYLNYNTGQRISTNGRQFSQLLEMLITQYPDITQIDLIGHSMGGLVSRSALYYGSEQQHNWVNKVQKLITLGSPHHGALLERIGDVVQQSISKLPFAGSLAKLGDIRSMGIIDLRHGSVRDEDWQSLQARSVLPDSERHPTPLPKHIAAYFLAGSLSEEGQASKVSDLLGDGLVNINSALGEHTTEHTLAVPKERKAVFYGVGHMALMSDEQVLDKTVEWLVHKL